MDKSSGLDHPVNPMGSFCQIRRRLPNDVGFAKRLLVGVPAHPDTALGSFCQNSEEGAECGHGIRGSQFMEHGLLAWNSGGGACVAESARWHDLHRGTVNSSLTLRPIARG
jgi:hypothetical protein